MSPFRGSNGIAFGPDGRLYVAEYLGGRISAVDLATAQVDFIEGPVQSPDDLAFGADGSMYITDLVPGRVWRRDPQGEYTLVSDEVKVPNGIACVGDRLFVNEMRVGGRLLELFPDGGEPVVLAEGLMLGNAMQLGPDGCLYYPHMLTNEVYRIPPDGGTPELVAEDVHEPVAVRFDREGVLMVLSRGVDGIITRIDQGQRKIITTGVMCLDNAAFDSDNRMYVSSYAGGGIAEVYPDGRTRQVVPSGLAGPYGVTVDSDGTVYAADHYRVVKPTGPELAIFTHGIVAADGQLHVTSQYGDVRTDGRERANGLAQPMGIAVRGDGALVVAEAGAGRVVAIDTDVTVLASFDSPIDVAFDAEQRCYVSDETGTVHRIDDGVVVASALAAPQGLAVHGDELFVVEVGLRRVLAIHLETGERRVVADDLPLSPERPRELFVHGMPGCPRRFVGLAVAPDGSLHVSGDGSVLRIPGSQGS
ncbi:hypothetical protein DMH04_46270 [Kibdelosporangium aridum]|uniref:Sugar lactone lactonase YvrE n=1 Tax=Kibdelosporangium aridum TaxID=2030 RepID=A0A428YMH0_KIBAR|nr:NHL repeat protein [Kibdelosporangium aridum]RSM69247.1 hypothetical protein DMH04_46270 [Kibdelosporangium aridum]